MKNLYLITGPAGVGKSTISKILVDKLNKSALIEGDDIYNMVKSGYVSPWKDGNHLELFWKNSIDLIINFLNSGYDVVFNYIIEKDDLERLKKEFKDTTIKFIVLMVDEETIMKRDKERPLDWQMGERALILLDEFRQTNYDEKYILNTSYLLIEEIVKEIENNKRFVLE